MEEELDEDHPGYALNQDFAVNYFLQNGARKVSCQTETSLPI